MAYNASDQLIEESKAAITAARRVRGRHRRRRLPERREALKLAFERNRRLLSRLRSMIARSFYASNQIQRADDLRECSKLLQREQRKLRKMLAVRRR